MKLALCAPLPLWTIPTARLAAGLLRPLQQGGDVFALTENPYRTQPGVSQKDKLRPLCDLPELVRTEAVELPIHLIGDDLLHLNQLRYVKLVPGLLVLPTLELDALRDGLRATIAEQERTLFAGFDGAPGLAATLATMSRGVALASEADAARLREQVPDARISVVPELAADPHDQDAMSRAAARLRDIADHLPAVPASERIAQEPRDPDSCPPVTAVVIGYNSKDIIGPCLQTLLDQDYPNLEVVVVDNASADGTAEFVQKNFPSVRLIASKENLGFAEGNNLVFRTTNSKYIALLNQDAYARRNWVTEMVRCAELDEKVGSVGSKMLFDRCPTLINSTAIEINEAGWGWDRQVGEKDEDPSPMPEEVFGGCGGAVMYRKSALDEVGGFDPAFFMYYEDTDLAWRLRLAGYTNLYAPLAVVRHDFHGDSGATPGRLYRRRFMSERNRWATLVKNLDWSTLRGVLPRIRKYDRGRLQWLQKAVKDNHQPEFHGQIAKIIKQAWRYNVVRLPQLWLRRRRTQKLRRVTAEVGRRFIVPGINEGGHQGDVENFHDRFSAQRTDCIEIGETDKGCLGSGWHTAEKPPGAPLAYRWCKGRAWFYLQPPANSKAIVCKLASPIRTHWFKLYAESDLLGEVTVTNEQGDFRFELPDDLPRDELLEFTLECQTVNPKEEGMSGDIRDLGVIVFKIWAVP